MSENHLLTKPENNKPIKNPDSSSTRRDFMVLMASSLTVIGAVCVTIPLIDSFNPSADVLALSTIEVDISKISPGQVLTVKWLGKPIFIKHRTENEIKIAQETKQSVLKDPQLDSNRVKKGYEKWLILIGVCTHLGCIPLSNQGDFKGWFCPCHGSHYDTSGRIRKGPAPINLEIPPYEFISDTKIKIG